MPNLAPIAPRPEVARDMVLPLAAGSCWFFGPGEKPGVAEEREATIYLATRPYHTLQQMRPSLRGRN